LATRLPKRFVMPCSSRFTRPPHPLRRLTTLNSGPGRRSRVPGRKPFYQASPSGGYAGLFVATLIEPLMMPCLTVFSSVCRLDGTLLAKSWNGDSATPPFCSVPM
jgi:hypothetical protein